jgi:hypothetical protein
MSVQTPIILGADFVTYNLHGDESVNAISPADRDTYLENILAAFRVYVTRDSIRRGLWKEYPARDQMRQVKIKSERVLSILENHTRDLNEAASLGAPPDVISEGIAQETSEREVMIEELHDIINYAVFSLRIIREGETIHD